MADDIASVRLLEALYDLELARGDWFRQILKAASQAFERGAGVGMLLYDVSGDGVRIEAMDAANVPGASIDMSVRLHAQSDMLDAIKGAYRNKVCATMQEHSPDPAMLQYLRACYAKVGVGDQVLINGANPDGLGCCLYIFSKERLQLEPAERALLTRLAAHLSAAYRLHRRVHAEPSQGLEGADVIVRADGRVEHVTAAVDSHALLGQLTHAVARREWARAPDRRSERGGAVAAWKPMVAARWSLVDAYERDGRRYITARENAPVRRDASALSRRERQVVAMAALGHSNKLVAYELGLAHSTVRVLLARASAKLGAHSRSELLEQFRAS
jgi:DNA-binding CsgD family transcriptional regulator